MAIKFKQSAVDGVLHLNETLKKQSGTGGTQNTQTAPSKNASASAGSSPSVRPSGFLTSLPAYQRALSAYTTPKISTNVLSLPIASKTTTQNIGTGALKAELADRRASGDFTMPGGAEDGIKSTISTLNKRESELSAALRPQFRPLDYTGMQKDDNTYETVDALAKELQDLQIQRDRLKRSLPSYKPEQLFNPDDYHSFSDQLAYQFERRGADLLGVVEGVADAVGVPLATAMEWIFSVGGTASTPTSELFGQWGDSLLNGSPTAEYEESIRQRYNPTEGMQQAGDFGSAVTQMLPAIGAAILTGGSSAAGSAINAASNAQRGATVGQALFGLQAAGGGMSEAAEEGANRTQAIVYGIESGLLETIVENVAGGIPFMNKGVISQAAQKVLSSPVLNKALDIAGEGGEEAVSAIITPYLKRAVYDSDAQNATADEIAESAIMGMIAAGVIQAGIELPQAISMRNAVNSEMERQYATDTEAQQTQTDPLQALAEEMAAKEAEAIFPTVEERPRPKPQKASVVSEQQQQEAAPEPSWKKYTGAPRADGTNPAAQARAAARQAAESVDFSSVNTAERESFLQAYDMGRSGEGSEVAVSALPVQSDAVYGAFFQGQDDYFSGNADRYAVYRPSERVSTQAEPVDLPVQEVQQSSQTEPQPVHMPVAGQKNTASTGETGTGLVPLNEQAAARLSSGKNNVIARKVSDIISFVRNARKKKGGPERLYLGTIPDTAAQLIRSSTGIDVTGYTAILPGDSVQHIFKNHGNDATENQRGQRAVTENDIALIPQVLSEPDRVLLSHNTDVLGRTVLLFEKRIGDNYVTAQAVTDGRHALTTNSLWIQKEKDRPTTPDAGDQTSPEGNAQSALSQSPSTYSIIAQDVTTGNHQASPGGTGPVSLPIADQAPPSAPSKKKGIQIPIDERTWQDAGNRKVNAFQYDSPELHPYFVEAAKALQYDLAASVKGERLPVYDASSETGKDIIGFTGTKRSVTEPIAQALDNANLSYAQIEKALSDLIADNGQENYAAAKKVELVLDDMLTNGYTDSDGQYVPPNQEYIAARDAASGAAQGSTEYRMSEAEWNSLLTQEPDGPVMMPVADAAVDTAAARTYDNDTADQPSPERNQAAAEINPDGSPVYARTKAEANIQPTDLGALKKRQRETAQQLGLSRNEASRLERYIQGFLCYEFNRRMENGMLSDGERAIASDIAQALSKFPLYEGRTYRNLKFDTQEAYDAFLTAYAEGSTITLKAFTSTSKRPNGYPVFGNGVVHMVVDGQSGRDIADTYGMPRQQEVTYLPGTELVVAKITAANDGNPLIYVKEVGKNGSMGKEAGGNYGNGGPQKGLYRAGDAAAPGTSSADAGGGMDPAVYGAARYRGRERDGVLPQRGESTDAGDVLVKGDPEGSVGAAPKEFDSRSSFQSTVDAVLLPVKQGDGRENSVGAKRSDYEYQQKRSKVGSNTFSKVYQEVLDQMEENGGNVSDLPYDVVSERKSMENAQQRLSVDFEGEVSDLPNRDAWSSEDLDTAMGVLDRYMSDALKTGNYDKVNEWARLIQSKGTNAGQMIQAFAKYTRTPQGVMVDAVNALDKSKLSAERKSEILSRVQEQIAFFDSIQEGDTGSLIDLIKQNSAIRRTGTFFRNQTSNALNAALEADSYEHLRDVALAQIDNIAKDYQPRTTAEKLRSARSMSMLSNITTVLRNLVGNQVFDPVDSFAGNTFVVPLDAFLSKFTGARSVAAENPFSLTKWRGAIENASRAYIETALDVSTEGVQNRYDQTSNRTFKMTGNPLERFLSTWSKYQGYSLNVTDEFAKGGVQAETQRRIDSLKERGLIKDDTLDNRGEEQAKYRTFQDDTRLSRTMLQARNALNNIGTEGFGAGDLLMPFARVPANLVTRAVEYSPLGLANGTAELIGVLQKAHNGTLTAAEQARAVSDIGRGMSGTVLIAAFGALAASGLIRVAGNGDGEEDKTALETSEGISGTQLNLSGALRWIAGEENALEWRDGDQLMSIGFLEPLNAQMTTGALLAEDLDGTETPAELFGNFLNSSFEGTVQSLLDLPAMSSLQDLANGYSYSTAETTGGKVADALTGYAASQVSSFVPNIVRSIARASDPYVRDVYSSGTIGGEAVDSIKNSLPVLRNTLPIRQTPFGEDRTYGDNQVMNALNAVILPGAITQYRTSDAAQELYSLPVVEDTPVYPRRNAPNSVSDEGTTYDLTYEQKTQYQKDYGQAYKGMIDSLMEQPSYQSATDKEKTEMLNMAREYASELAKTNVLQGIGVSYTPEGWIGGAVKSGVPETPYLLYRFSADADGNKTITQSEAAAALLPIRGLTDQQKGTVWQNQNSSWSENKNPFTGALRSAGISADTSAEILSRYSEIDNADYQGDSVARQKQTALSQYLDGLGLTDAQRTVVDDTYKFYNMFPADPIPYSIETMSDAAQARWPAAQAEGMSEEEFLKYYPIRAQSGTGITKEVKLRQLQEAGMTYQEANDFWNLTK